MAPFVVDTNVLVYLASSASVQHVACQQAVEALIERGGSPALSCQAVYES